MKTSLEAQRCRHLGTARGLQLCAVAADRSLTINGRIYTSDHATAYMEFNLSHAFPVYLDNAAPGEMPERTAIHPQVVANSYRSLAGKVVNLGHIMRAYDPEQHPRDRILGTVMDVEFPPAPAGGWTVQGDPGQAPGIRAVAALHKQAEGVPTILETWEQGRTPFSETPWTVSMESESRRADGGFLVRCGSQAAQYGLDDYVRQTPSDLLALDWVYVPWGMAPAGLLECLKAGEYLGLDHEYYGLPTRFLNGGLAGRIAYHGVGLVTLGKESAAAVSRMVAGRLITPETLVETALRRVQEGVQKICAAAANGGGTVVG